MLASDLYAGVAALDGTVAAAQVGLR